MDAPQHQGEVVLPAFPPELEIALVDGQAEAEGAIEPATKRQRLENSQDSALLAAAQHQLVEVNGDEGSIMGSTSNLSIATEDDGEATDGETPLDANPSGDASTSLAAESSGLVNGAGGLLSGQASVGGEEAAACTDDGALRQDAQFDERLRELEEFKAKYGHCRVPQVWKENKRLGQWVATMRNLKKANKLPHERVRQLESVGFVWCCRNVTASGKGEKRKLVPWNERFEELKAFKDKYGHCNVPHKWSENVKLSNWLYCQRSFHRHGKLSQDKIRRLESIGFEWSKQDPPPATVVVVVKKRKSGTLSASADGPFDTTAANDDDALSSFASAATDQQTHQQPHQQPPSLVEHHHHHHHQAQAYPAMELLQPTIGQGSTITTDRQDRLVLDAAAGGPVGAGGVEATPATAALASLMKARRGSGPAVVDSAAAGADAEGGNNSEEAQRRDGGEVGHEGEEGHEGEGEEEVIYQPSSVKERKSWYERYQELVAFKQTHGHCNVPWKWKENMPLFYWVRRMKDKKRANALSAEKVSMMEELGFEWVKGQNKEKERRKQQLSLIEQKQKELEDEREGLVAAAVRARLVLPGDLAASAGAPHGGAETVAVAVADAQGMLSPFAYNFSSASYTATSPTSGALVGTAYYPVYAKLPASAIASVNGEFTFDAAALAASVAAAGSEMVAMDANGQHTLYAHPHGDLAALQHYMTGEEMKEAGKEDGMEAMDHAMHHAHEGMHHHHHNMEGDELHHHHHVDVHGLHHHVDVSGSDGHVHMVQVIHNADGQLEMSEMSFHESLAGDENHHHHHHHHHGGGDEQAMVGMADDVEQPPQHHHHHHHHNGGDVEGAHHHHHHHQDDAYAAYHHAHEEGMHAHHHPHHAAAEEEAPNSNNKAPSG